MIPMILTLAVIAVMVLVILAVSLTARRSEARAREIFGTKQNSTL